MAYGKKMSYGKKMGKKGMGMGGSSGKSMNYSPSYGSGGNEGKAIGDKGMKAKGNKRTRQVADRYK